MASANVPPGDNGGAVSPTEADPAKGLETTTSLESLQSEEQRNVLNVIDRLRKCGLESMLSLPQLVVCGDQSAGKSSVLEALTQIPFPRSDNLCTRYATEIILRRGMSDTVTVKVIPNSNRPSNEQDLITAFHESLSDFEHLPNVMAKATALMGVGNNQGLQGNAFSKDVLSIEIEGPSRPQLTLVDLPGLIQTETKGVTEEEVVLVREITDKYISQHRTICLAVVSAANDYANQGILKKVRMVDPEGNRTLGIITKPDRAIAGSGSETSYIGLAKNEDVFFKLGWHVLKNREFGQSAFSFEERNRSEAAFFQDTNFSVLLKDCVGVDSLRNRLSQLLFDHVKQELPRLREDLDGALERTQHQLGNLGTRRVTLTECKGYLMELSQEVLVTGKAAINGHYEGEYFLQRSTLAAPASIRRLRAAVRLANSSFSEALRTQGHRYYIQAEEGDEELHEEDDEEPGPDASADENEFEPETPTKQLPHPGSPTELSHPEALKWVHEVLMRTRGKELQGTFNPLLIGELFWEQSEKWEKMADNHMMVVAHLCSQFMKTLLQEKCSADVYHRLWSFRFEETLKVRYDSAEAELARIMEDVKSYPQTNNHYYTDTIQSARKKRGQYSLMKSIKEATKTEMTYNPQSRQNITTTTINEQQVARDFFAKHDPNMDTFSCEEALDCLQSIYKLTRKTFTDNINMQVVERHIVRHLEQIFSPTFMNTLDDTEVLEIASEPASVKRQRTSLEEKLRKLKDGSRILRGVIRSAGS